MFIADGKGGHQRRIPISGRFFATVADYLRAERPASATTDRVFVVLKGQRRGQPLSDEGAAEADPLTVARAFPKIADAIRSSTSTDIPVEALPDLIELAARLDFDDIATVALTAPRYAAGDDGLGHPRPDVGKIRAAVAAALEGGSPAGAEAPGDCG